LIEQEARRWQSGPLPLTDPRDLDTTGAAALCSGT
jgi:hypothetical protein